MVTLSSQRQTGHWKYTTKSIKNCPWAKTTRDVIWREIRTTGLEHLERRREYFSVVECYKRVFELNGLECRDYFEFCNNNTRSNNSFKIRMKCAKVNAFKYSFFMRIRNGTTYPTTFLEMTLILINLNIIWKSGWTLVKEWIYCFLCFF